MKNKTIFKKQKKGGVFSNIFNNIRKNSNYIKEHTNTVINQDFKYSPFSQVFNIKDIDYNTIIKKYNLSDYIDYLNSNDYGTCFKTLLDDDLITGGEGKETVVQYINRNKTNFNNLRQYCKKFYTVDKLKKYNNAIGYISNEINEINEEDKKEVEYLLNNLNDIYKIISDNNTKFTIEYKIEFDKINVDNFSLQFSTPLIHDLSLRETRQINNKQFIRKFEYYDFNKDYILGYQGKQLELYSQNKKQIDDYIIQQNSYIQKLSLEDKRILTDYTRLKSFTLYQEYVKASEKDFTSGNIVDNFIDIIKNYYPDKYKGKETLLENMGNAFIDIIERLKIFKITTDEYQTLKRVGYNSNSSELYLNITNDEWKLILKKYLKKLNNIILNAPPVPAEFICYRGVSNDYTISNITIPDKEYTIPAFISTRTGSISLNYEKSKYYYDKGEDKNKSTMYRVLVLPGCKLLFASPLAGEDIIDEMELITPSNQIFVSNNWVVEKKYNNYQNKNNICFSKDDIINSKDLILIPDRI